jgi:hypothetical protein
MLAPIIAQRSEENRWSALFAMALTLGRLPARGLIWIG